MLFLQLYFGTSFYTSGTVLNDGDMKMNKIPVLKELPGLSNVLNYFLPSDGRMIESSMDFPF